jgi:alanine racemase
MSTSQGSSIEIDRKALQSNVDAFRTEMKPDCRLMAVVKANAYGHGLEIVAPALAPKADWFGVNSLEEAVVLERLNLDRPISILGHTAPEHASEIVRYGFRQVLFRVESAKALSTVAGRLGRTATVHIKVETGTNRLGVPLAELGDFLRTVRGLPGLEIEGMYTHFANIEDTLDPSFAQLQLRRFRDGLQIAKEAGVEPSIVHTSASAGVLLYPETHFSMVRVGIGLYGIWPSRETRIAARERRREIELRPVLTWKTRIAQLKTAAAGDFVGYGLTYRVSRNLRLAVLPVGYYDGYDRKLSNGGRALVRGRSVPVVGRIAMNMTMLDVTDTDSAEDDEVVLIGKQGEAEITADELAEKTGTIAYETLSRVHPTIPRLLR